MAELTLHLSVPITRRKTIHMIMDEDETVLWRGKNADAAFDWLLEFANGEFLVIAQDAEYRCKTARINPEKENRK